MSCVEDLLEGIESGRVKNLEEIRSSFEKMHKNYYIYEWTWAIDRILKEEDKNFGNIWAKDVISLTEKWKQNVVELDQMLYDDAKKEFTLSSQTGFGVDGDKDTQVQDFEQVRGEFEKNPLVSAIKDHIVKKTALGEELIQRMKKVLD